MTTKNPPAAMLRRCSPDEVAPRRGVAFDRRTEDEARVIVDDVAAGGVAAVRCWAARFDGLGDDEPLVLDRDGMERAAAGVDADVRGLLERVAGRIRAFADAQRAALGAARLDVPGGVARHRVVPVDRAGCYAPGGRFPLPSSVLMTAVTARAAGVEDVWVASPKPAAVTVAAALAAGADAFLRCGGAQAIAVMAHGAAAGGDDPAVPACDVICGPGNRWVTAAKAICAARVRIDMLAGPSELLVVADATADPVIVAADLLAQAEHDDDAAAMLVAVGDADIVDAVDRELARQLEDLPTAATARTALANGFATVAADRAEARRLCDAIAPEHLQLSIADARGFAEGLRHYGGLFVGEQAAEVLGDYGAGPNHVLPTGGTARGTAGLSVLDFVRVQTSLELDDPAAAGDLRADAARLARLEGLEAHARAAEARG